MIWNIMLGVISTVAETTTTASQLLPSFPDGKQLVLPILPTIESEDLEKTPEGVFYHILGAMDTLEADCGIQGLRLAEIRDTNGPELLFAGNGKASDALATATSCMESLEEPFFDVNSLYITDPVAEISNHLEILLNINYDDLIADFVLISNQINDSIQNLFGQGVIYSVQGLEQASPDSIKVTLTPKSGQFPSDVMSAFATNIHALADDPTSFVSLSNKENFSTTTTTTTTLPTTTTTQEPTTVTTSTTTTTVATTTTTSTEEGGLQTSGIVGISVGAVALLGGIGAGTYWAVSRKEKEPAVIIDVPQTPRGMEAMSPVAQPRGSFGAEEEESPLRARSPAQRGSRGFNM